MNFSTRIIVLFFCMSSCLFLYAGEQQVTITPHKDGIWDNFFGPGDNEFVCYNKVHRNFYVAIFISVIAIAVIALSRYRIKKKSANMLEVKNKMIEEKNKDILDSIHYAQRIQNAILPRNEQIKDWFSDYFILYKPKDIVSGDFYWASKKGSKTIIAAV